VFNALNNNNLALNLNNNNLTNQNNKLNKLKSLDKVARNQQIEMYLHLDRINLF